MPRTLNNQRHSASPPWPVRLLLVAAAFLPSDASLSNFTLRHLLSLTRSIALPASLPAHLVVQIYPDILWTIIILFHFATRSNTSAPGKGAESDRHERDRHKSHCPLCQEGAFPSLRDLSEALSEWVLPQPKPANQPAGDKARDTHDCSSRHGPKAAVLGPRWRGACG